MVFDTLVTLGIMAGIYLAALVLWLVVIVHERKKR